MPWIPVARYARSGMWCVFIVFVSFISDVLLVFCVFVFYIVNCLEYNKERSEIKMFYKPSDILELFFWLFPFCFHSRNMSQQSSTRKDLLTLFIGILLHSVRKWISPFFPICPQRWAKVARLGVRMSPFFQTVHWCSNSYPNVARTAV